MKLILASVGVCLFFCFLSWIDKSEQSTIDRQVEECKRQGGHFRMMYGVSDECVFQTKDK